MVKNITVLITLFLSLFAYSQSLVELSRKQDRIAFLDSTQRHHKNAFLFVVSSSCAPCDDMKSRVLSDDSVHLLINHHVNTAQVNVSTELGDYIVKKYHIKRLPSSIIYSREGEYLTMIRGDVPRDNFLNILNSALIYEQVMGKLKQTDLTNQELFFCIEALNFLRKDSAARVFSKQYIGRLSNKQLISESNDLVLRNYMSDLDDPKTNFMLQNGDTLTKVYGPSFYDDMVRNLFEYNLSQATSTNDTTIIHKLQEEVLRVYLDDKAFEEGKSGLWQRYYIGTAQWNKNKQEVLKCYMQVQDESYLLNRASIVLQKYYTIPQMVQNAIDWLLEAEHVEKNFENQLMLGQLYLIKKDYKNAKKKAKKAKKYANVRSKINRVDDLDYNIEIQTEKK